MAIGGKRWQWILGGVVVVLAAVAVVLFFLFRDTATPVTREEVADEMEGLSGDGTPGSPGVYTYSTTGFEEVDAFGGGHHPYPAETYLTIRPEGCGVAVRWQPLEERTEEHIICDDGRLEQIDSYHVWFGVPDRSIWECGADAHKLPLADETAWSFGCEKPGDSTQQWEYEVLGTETLEVGGQSVETIHIVGRETLEGRTTGGSEVHDWVLPGTRLSVRRSSISNNTTETAIGAVSYHEVFEINLVSLNPQS